MPSTIWKGHLTFGLISIPVKLSRAARAEKIRMHRLQRGTGARVRQVFVPAESQNPSVPLHLPVPTPPITRESSPRTAGNSASNPASIQSSRPAGSDNTGLQHTEARDREPLSPAELTTGFEYEKDKYVEFEPEELKRLAPQRSTEMQISQFVRLTEVDPVYLETSYYVAPDEGGAKPYALLFGALQKTGYAALAGFVLNRRDQIIILRPGPFGIIAHTLFHEDEVRHETEFHADSALIAPKEMDLAVQLIEALTMPFEPAKFSDKYRDRLKQAISEKVQNGEVPAVETAAPRKPVIDIMAALKASLSKTKKPAGSEVKSVASHRSGKKRSAGAS